MTIKTIAFTQKSSQEFVSQVSALLAGRELGKIVSLTAQGNAIVVCFSKFGKSELTYDVAGAPNSGSSGIMTATLVSEKIALAHRAFRSDIEGKLKKVLIACGAKLTEG
jgi:hypothetical protein